jgi:hypothetical protein
VARIFENDIPAVIASLQMLLAANNTPVISGLSEDEVALLREHRRKIQIDELFKKGIEIAPPRKIEPSPLGIVEQPSACSP